MHYGSIFPKPGRNVFTLVCMRVVVVWCCTAHTFSAVHVSEAAVLHLLLALFSRKTVAAHHVNAMNRASICFSHGLAPRFSFSVKLNARGRQYVMLWNILQDCPDVIKLWNLGRIHSMMTSRALLLLLTFMDPKTVNIKSTRRDVMIERIRPKFHSLDVILVQLLQRPHPHLGMRRLQSWPRGAQRYRSVLTFWIARDNYDVELNLTALLYMKTELVFLLIP